MQGATSRGLLRFAFQMARLMESQPLVPKALFASLGFVCQKVAQKARKPARRLAFWFARTGRGSKSLVEKGRYASKRTALTVFPTSTALKGRNALMACA
jgi:hypothetical protein